MYKICQAYNYIVMTNKKNNVKKQVIKQVDLEKIYKKHIKKLTPNEANIFNKLLELNANPEKDLVKLVISECTTPSFRSSLSFHYVKNCFILFGGEYYDMKNCYIYSDTYKWTPNKENEWKMIQQGIAPLPRVAQASTIHNDLLYIHGGEYNTMHNTIHYNDLWKLNPSTLEWKKENIIGVLPSPRSGHKIISIRNYIILFGGYYDSFNESKYYNDLYIYHTKLCKFISVMFNKSYNLPKPRSGAVLCANDYKLIVAGGFSKGIASETAVTGKYYNDFWQLNLSEFFELTDDYFINKDTYTFKSNWIKETNKFMSRAGMAFCSNKANIYIFGGVLDEDLGGCSIKSVFMFNDIQMFNTTNKLCKHLFNRQEYSKLSKHQYYAYVYVKSELLKVIINVELLMNRVKNVNNEIQLYEIIETITLSNYNNTYNQPLPRLNASITYNNNQLFLMGGIHEVGKQTIVLDDYWYFDIKKESWHNLKEGTFWHKLTNMVIVADNSSDSDTTNESDSDSLASGVSSEDLNITKNSCIMNY